MNQETDSNLRPLLNADNEKGSFRLSRWWIFAIAFVMLYGFAFLIAITTKAYDDKPPIPEEIIDNNGNVLFTGNDIKGGQTVFLKYGLMDNGTVWGHGAYLGPDFPALYLHRLGETIQEAITIDIYEMSYSDVLPYEQLSIDGILPSILKENRYDSERQTLQFTEYETNHFKTEIEQWRAYFSNPKNNGGLKADLIANNDELFQLTAFFAWAAWASVANRPGEDYSYTNNFPYDPLVGNIAPPSLMGWSVASIIFLLAAIGLILFVLGKHKQWEWHSNDGTPLPSYVFTGQATPTESALVKFVCVVGILFLAQTLVGGGVAHYRADPGNFYGFDLSILFPSSLLRTWHLQLAIFWIATGFVAGGLYLARILGGQEYKGQKILTNLLFAAFALVIFGSLLSEWAGLSGWWQDATFWLGSQGWEYLELGRLWQILLIVGLLSWFALIVRSTRPALKRESTRRITIMFLVAAFAIPLFYLPALFYGSETHYTVVDTWRFWIIHLWVEGFFELFATTMVALIFIELGLINRKIGLRIIYLDAILILMGGIIGTGHHWYFSGQTQFNTALSACFSALEVVPLVILCLEGYSFMKTSNNPMQESSITKFKWTLRFLMAVGFWNFVGAGIFGFLINMPIVSYYEIGTMLTPNHGHAAMFGVFGMLSLALCTFVLRQVCKDEHWPGVEKWVKISFWGVNIGLVLMIVMSLVPGGFAQLYDVVENGYWHARSIEFCNDKRMSLIGWLRMPGDLVFIIFGAIPFLIAGLKVWFRQIGDKRK
ncbi:MAG: nitric-oxide reductase large subunit [Marinifilaceae bacterium]